MTWAVHVLTKPELQRKAPRGQGPLDWAELLSAAERQAYSPPHGGCLVVARDAGALGGWAGFKRIAPKACEIGQFVVRSEYRGKGLGTRLMQGLLNEARRMGYARVVSRLEPWCPEWRAFYTGHGFAFVNADDEDTAAASQGAMMELVLD